MFSRQIMASPWNSVPARPPANMPPPVDDPDHGEPDEKEPLDRPEKHFPDYDEDEPIDPDKDTLVEPLEPDEEDEGPVTDHVHTVTCMTMGTGLTKLKVYLRISQTRIHYLDVIFCYRNKWQKPWSTAGRAILGDGDDGCDPVRICRHFHPA